MPRVQPRLSPLTPPARIRFDYGDDGSAPFVQLLPTTVLDDAYADFNISRSTALAALPPTISPADLVDIANSQSTDDSAASSSSPTKVSGGAAEATTGSTDSALYSLVDKYGPVVIGLLAGNLLVGVLLLIVGLAACLRGHVRSGAKARDIGSSYAPVRFKEAEADEAREYRD